MPSTLQPEANPPINSHSKPTTNSTPIAPAMPLISPTALLKAHLQQTPPTRPSNRAPSTPHRIDANIGSLTHTNGSAVVKIGATTIVCGVRAEILLTSQIPCYDARSQATFTARSSSSSNQDDGGMGGAEEHSPLRQYNLLVPNLELSTGCSPLHPANSAPSTQAQSITQRLYTLLLTSKLIDPADLAINYTPPPPETDAERIDPDDPAFVPREEQTKAFWVLYIDMVCVSYGGEGSVFDAAWLSLCAALRDTVLPRAWWDADLRAVLCDEDVGVARGLRLRGGPVSLGFGVVNCDRGGLVSGDGDGNGNGDRRWVLVDPDAFEEQCCDEMGCVAVDLSSERTGKRIVRIEKSGGGFVGSEEMKGIIAVAERRWREWNELLEGCVGRRSVSKT